jgi:hypothetical protein
MNQELPILSRKAKYALYLWIGTLSKDSWDQWKKFLVEMKKNIKNFAEILIIYLRNNFMNPI